MTGGHAAFGERTNREGAGLGDADAGAMMTATVATMARKRRVEQCSDAIFIKDSHKPILRNRATDLEHHAFPCAAHGTYRRGAVHGDADHDG